MEHTHNIPKKAALGTYTEDMARGFEKFADSVLRARENKTILNASIGVAALEVGIPKSLESLAQLDITKMVINNSDLFSKSTNLFEHPLFDFSSDSFTLFGLDFNDLWNQLGGAASVHHSPYFRPEVGRTVGVEGDSLGHILGLPDLPYGELAHFAHLGIAVYDTGRTFQDLWNAPELHHNVLKVMTHPEMAHTLAMRGVMLTVMGLLHPLGPLVSLGTAYLCMHLVHTFFTLLEDNREAVRAIENVPVLKHIYNATGIKEWAEAKTPAETADQKRDEVDPFSATSDSLYEAPETQLAKSNARKLEGKACAAIAMKNGIPI